ncbi:MAG TPA: iron-sulfur cluster assembly accessory protein [Edaphocola sp.]|nr:iron-sulfur cluster assembly accessory protein [Edaphocola sp.]
MIYITEKAVERVRQIQKEEQLADNFFIRVSVVGGGCSGLSYKLDFDNQPQQGDQVFVDKGITLVTDIKSFLYLCDTTLDYSDGLDGKGFHFINPNASRTCACGESFAV